MGLIDHGHQTYNMHASRCEKKNTKNVIRKGQERDTRTFGANLLPKSLRDLDKKETLPSVRIELTTFRL